jgi:hypothetical protein
MAQLIQIAGDTYANWTAWNGVLNLNEMVLETDTKKIKVGDGTTVYSSLPYYAATVSVSSTANTVVLRDGSGNIFASGINVNDGILQRFIPNIRTVTGTTDTLLASDNGGVVRYTSASPVTLTLPNNLVVGFNVNIFQRGAGQVTWSPASGATATSAQGFVKTGGFGAGMHFFVDTNSGGTAATYIVQGYGQ